MAITFLRDEGKQAYANSDNIACDSIEVAAGNLVIVGTEWPTGQAETPTFTDSAGNSFTSLTRFANASNVGLCIGYAIVTNASGTDVVTATWTTAQTETKSIIVTVFSKGAGDTWAFDVENTGATNYGTAVESGAFTTTGSDEVVIAFVGGSGTVVQSSPQVDGNAATEIDQESVENMDGFYYLPGTTLVSKTATATITAVTWAINVAAFKATGGGGGGSIVPLVMAHMRRRRN